MANEQDQLTYQLSHISIGTADDTLSKQLDNTHLFDKHTTSYTPTTHTINEPQTPWPSAVLQRPTADIPTWQQQQQSKPPTTITDNEEGWGEAPAYTSLLPYTEFGFTSTIVPSLGSIPSSCSQQNDSITLDPNQPFSRHRHQRSAFARFTSPANNASDCDQ